MSCRRFTRVAGLLLLTVALSGLGGLSAGGPTPQAAAQAEIGQLLQAIAAANSGGTTEGIPAMAERLRLSVGDGRGALLLQILLYRAGHTGNEPAMAIALLVDFYGFTDDEKIAALVPQLDSDLPGLRELVWEMLSTVDRESGGPPDFGLYEPLLDDCSGERSGLIRYMYTVAPIEALTVMARVHAEGGAAELIRRARQLEESADPLPARRELDALSRDPAWWVRLYAAHVVRARPDLATDELIERLRADPRELIREAVGG